MKFRSQLGASFGRLSNTQISDPDLPGLENVDITNTSLISKVSNTGLFMMSKISYSYVHVYY